MVPLNIVLYSLRSMGYVYQNGAYGSDISQARAFTADEAIAYMKKFVNHEGASILLPVDRDVLASVQVI